MIEDKENVANINVQSNNTSSSSKSSSNGKKKAQNASRDSIASDGGVQYQMMSEREHVYHRPDTFIGSVKPQQAEAWVMRDATSEFPRVVSATIEYPPGLMSIFDEVIVNAADHYNRTKGNAPSKRVSEIKVTIDPESGSCSVWNDGPGISLKQVTIAEVSTSAASAEAAAKAGRSLKEKMFIPTMIFSEFRTSSNYNDDEERTTGGRNGYGAKLTNIFSSEFSVETRAGGSHFIQTWTDQMSATTGPQFTKSSPGKDYTRISFTPDLARFGMTHLTDDVVSLLQRRVFDIAGILGGKVKVFLNDVYVPVKSWADYVGLYEGIGPVTTATVQTKGGHVWDVALTVSPDDTAFRHVSFVNSVNTSRGGPHVDELKKEVATFLANTIYPVKVKNPAKKTKKETDDLAKNKRLLKAAGDHLWLFVNAVVVNPSFTTQSKQELSKKNDGVAVEIPKLETAKTAGPGKKNMMAKFLDTTDIRDRLDTMMAAKEEKDLAKNTNGKKTRRLKGIAKLDDANLAGTGQAGSCTLILTEGDSAKALAVSGLSVVGRDKYGVFPLRGKLLNVRDASISQVTSNEEIKALFQIVGLKTTVKYETEAEFKTLRYGHVMIMADQDHDGSHIKGLVINFFHKFWPALVKRPGFLKEFITPIVKVTKGREARSFFTLPEYEAWSERHSGETGWNTRYYKGLGTSTSKEAKAYFSNLLRHMLPFSWSGPEDKTAIELAFSKSKADDRKDWLRAFVPGTFLDHRTDAVTYSDFVNKELILFSLADNIRSIPSMVDGLKPGQRKILFAAFKRKLTSDIKVAQLAGYVAEHSAYHHGEQSLASTIIGMAQDFVGSNNINTLVPSGQFGTRLQGGKDAASPRYVYTRLAKITRYLFHQHDDEQLKYLVEDGQKIEPEWYLPILPMVLVNGSDGIGTGWSSSVPMYNPMDIVANLRRRLVSDSAECLEPMQPWYRGFTGAIKPAANGSFALYGRAERMSPTTVRITELPVRSWTQSFKEFLETALEGADSGSSKGAKGKGAKGAKAAAGENGNGGAATASKTWTLKDFREHHTERTVDFTLEFTSASQLDNLIADGLYKKLRLSTSVSTSNMMLFDENGRIRSYSTPEDILEAFYHVRLDYYIRRKAAQLARLAAEMDKLDNKVRFIGEVNSGTIKIGRRPKSELILELQKKNYLPIDPPKKKGSSSSSNDNDGDDHDGDDGLELSARRYDYLLGMALWSLTKEKEASLAAEAAQKKAEYGELERTTPKQLWERDLDDFEEVWQSLLAGDEKERSGSKAAKKRGAAKRSTWSDDDADEWGGIGDDDDDSDDWGTKKSKAKKSKAKASALDAASRGSGELIPVPSPVIKGSRGGRGGRVALAPLTVTSERLPMSGGSTPTGGDADASVKDTSPFAIGAAIANARPVQPASKLFASLANLKSSLANKGSTPFLTSSKAKTATTSSAGTSASATRTLGAPSKAKIAPAMKTKVSKTAASAAVPKKKKKRTVISDSEEEEDDAPLTSDSEGEGFVEPPAPRARTARRAATTATKKYVVDDDDDEAEFDDGGDDEDEIMDDFDDDDDDFDFP